MNSFFASVSNGFYRYTQFLFYFVKKPEDYASELLKESMKLDSISMFKLVIEKCPPIHIFDEILDYAVLHSYFHIVKYIVESNAKLTKNGYLNCLKSSISTNSEIFHYLLNIFGFEKLISDLHFGEDHFIQIVNCGCQNNKIDDVKILTDMIIEKYPNASFAYPFIVSVQHKFYNICKYFIDNNIFIDLYTIANHSEDLKSIDVDVFCKLIEKADPELKDILFCNLLGHSLISRNKKLVEFLMQQNIPYDNALFDSVNSQDVEMVKIVIKYNSKPSFINQLSDQGTALHLAVLLHNSEIVSFLLTIPGIDPNLYQQKSQTPLVLAIINFDMKIMDILLDFYGNEIDNQMWQLNEALDTILKIISAVENSNQHKNQKGWGNNNNNEVSIDHKLVLAIIKRLLRFKNLDLNRHSKNHTLLTYACQNNDLELVKMLIESEKIDINSYIPNNGSTSLMVAINNANIEIVKLLIESPRCNINISNYMKETALTIAVNKNKSEIVSLLISNPKFDPVESRLDYAFYISQGEISKLLISHTKPDVNFKVFIKQNSDLVSFETTLIHAVKSNDILKIGLILNHESFDPIKSQSKLAIFHAAELGFLDIFRQLLPLVNNDVNISLEKNNSLLIVAVKNHRENIINEIINNDSFSSNKSHLLDAFVETFGYKPSIQNNNNKTNSWTGNNNNYGYGRQLSKEKVFVDSIAFIYSYDSMHDHCIDFTKLLPNGKSFFTSINYNFENIDIVIRFLLENGAQPDMPDSDGVYPLQHAIKLNSSVFVRLLLQTKNIDLKRSLSDSVWNNDWKEEIRDNMTYLHLAAKAEDSTILNILLSLNVIDVNSADDHGETPLFIAIRYTNEVAIQSLFILDNLDYKHVNNNGMDPLKMIVYINNYNSNQPTLNAALEKLSQINSKGDYMSYIRNSLKLLKNNCERKINDRIGGRSYGFWGQS